FVHQTRMPAARLVLGHRDAAWAVTGWRSCGTWGSGRTMIHKAAIWACVSAAMLAPALARAQAPCTAPEGIKLVTPGTILAATNPTSAPLQYVDEQGKIVGMDMELGQAIAAKLCLKVQYASTEFATMIPGLKGGRYDMIDTFMYYTPERAEQVHMIPYGAATLAIVVPTGATGGETLADFSGKKFGAQLGSTDYVNAAAASKALVDAGKPAIDLRTFPNYADLLQALSAGQLDGVFLSTDGAFYYKSKGIGFFRIAASGLFPHAETIAFADPALADKAAVALDAMKADGSYGRILGAYHHCELPGPFKVTTGPLPNPSCPPFNG
ncbi:MAG: ABC transporter substrate-binding protein, partial [Janthinobacterium lividum]